MNSRDLGIISCSIVHCQVFGQRLLTSTTTILNGLSLISLGTGKVTNPASLASEEYFR